MENDALAGTKNALEVVAVKPLGVEDAGVGAGGEIENAATPAPAQPYQAGGEHLALHGGHLAGLQLTDGGEVDAVLVTKGEVVEKVFKGADAFLGEVAGAAGADAGEDGDGRFQ